MTFCIRGSRPLFSTANASSKLGRWAWGRNVGDLVLLHANTLRNNTLLGSPEQLEALDAPLAGDPRRRSVHKGHGQRKGLKHGFNEQDHKSRSGAWWNAVRPLRNLCAACAPRHSEMPFSHRGSVLWAEGRIRGVLMMRSSVLKEWSVDFSRGKHGGSAVRAPLTAHQASLQRKQIRYTGI